MPLDEIIVTIAGLAGVAFAYWFFLAKKERAVAVSGSVEIVVDGGYTPAAISIRKGKTTSVHFIRKDPSSCLEEVVISDFKIRRHLPLNRKVTIELAPVRSGTFDFTCGMNMYHGKIIVR